MDQVAKVATVVLATYEDEVAMHHCRSVRDAATRLADVGVPEVVVKCGAEGPTRSSVATLCTSPRRAWSAWSTPPLPVTLSPADI